MFVNSYNNLFCNLQASQKFFLIYFYYCWIFVFNHSKYIAYNDHWLLILNKIHIKYLQLFKLNNFLFKYDNNLYLWKFYDNLIVKIVIIINTTKKSISWNLIIIIIIIINIILKIASTTFSSLAITIIKSIFRRSAVVNIIIIIVIIVIIVSSAIIIRHNIKIIRLNTIIIISTSIKISNLVNISITIDTTTNRIITIIIIVTITNIIISIINGRYYYGEKDFWSWTSLQLSTKFLFTKITSKLRFLKLRSYKE